MGLRTNWAGTFGYDCYLTFRERSQIFSTTALGWGGRRICGCDIFYNVIVKDLSRAVYRTLKCLWEVGSGKYFRMLSGGGSQGRNRHPISAGLILAAEKANSAFLQAITQKVGNTKLVPQAKDS